MNETELLFKLSNLNPNFALTVRYLTVAQKAQTQINFPKHVTVSQNTNQFPKAQNSFQKHKLIFQNTNQFHETLISFWTKRLGTILMWTR